MTQYKIIETSYKDGACARYAELYRRESSRIEERAYYGVFDGEDTPFDDASEAAAYLLATGYETDDGMIYHRHYGGYDMFAQIVICGR